MSRGSKADETILNYANKQKTSFKTTVPSFIISQFRLDKGDKLKWAISGDKNGEFLKVRPIRIIKKGEMQK